MLWPSFPKSVLSCLCNNFFSPLSNVGPNGAPSSVLSAGVTAFWVFSGYGFTLIFVLKLSLLSCIKCDKHLFSASLPCMTLSSVCPFSATGVPLLHSLSLFLGHYHSFHSVQVLRTDPCFPRTLALIDVRRRGRKQTRKMFPPHCAYLCQEGTLPFTKVTLSRRGFVHLWSTWRIKPRAKHKVSNEYKIVKGRREIAQRHTARRQVAQVANRSNTVYW